jgi:hypothetical protein
VNPHPDGVPVIILEEASFDNLNEEKFWSKYLHSGLSNKNVILALRKLLP